LQVIYFYPDKAKNKGKREKRKEKNWKNNKGPGIKLISIIYKV
jgi:hypothetical protein